MTAPVDELATAGHDGHGFVSRLLTKLLVEAGGAPQPAARRLTGAVLLSDIAGFTGHVEAMSRRGGDGLERFAAALGEYFVRFVTDVLDQGGDVVTIAGDAFFCVYPDDRPEHGLRRAIATATNVQHDLDGHPVGGDRRFRTRIGIAAGELSLAPLGGVDGQWHLVMTGSPVDEVAAAEHAAPPGRILVAAGAEPWLHGLDGVVAHPAADGRWLLTPGAWRGRRTEGSHTPPVLDDGGVTAAYVPAFMRQPGAVDPRWFAEFRRLAVAMTSLPIVVDTAAEVAAAHAGISAIQRIVADLGGTTRVAIDSKGLTVASMFGLPPTAHENDIERALRAALAINQELLGLGMRTSTGVTTGRAFCGVLGDRRRREYAVAGDVVNRAARLMDHADGGVICDEVAADAARGRLEFSARPPVTVKGLAAPLPVRVPHTAAAGIGSVPRPMVGRSAERERLRDALRELHAGGPGDLIVVLGEAGLGKSRLLADLRDRALDLEIPVYLVAGDAIDRSTGYHGWRPFFTTILRDEARRPAAVAAELLADEPELLEVLPLLDAVVATGLEEDERTAALVGESRAATTNALLARLVELALVGRPTVLLVDDAHWLDSLSLELVRRVATLVPGLLTVVGTRPSSDTLDGLEPFIAASAQACITLSPLPDADTDELVRIRLETASVPAELATFVRTRCEGHPFFCEELLEAMTRAGTISMVDGECQTVDLETSDVPSTVEGVIVTRIDGLGPQEQLTLKVAAVLGRSFKASELRAVHPLAVGAGDVEHHLAAIAAAALIEPADADDPDSHSFRHVLTRDTAYGMMTGDQRVHVHRAASEWYEANVGTADGAAPAVIAHHCEHGQRHPEAVDFLERAAWQALRAGSFREAIRSLDRATILQRQHRVAVTDTRRALWDKGMGTAQYFLGDLSAAREHLQRAAATLHRPIPPDPRRAVLALAREAAVQVAHRVRPGHFLGRRAGESELLDHAVDCYKILSQISYLDGAPPAPLIHLTIAGLNVAEESGESANLASIMVSVGTLLDVAGAHRWGDWYATRAIAMTESTRNRGAGAYVHNIHALLQGQRGHWDAALAANDRALETLDAIGDDSLEADLWLTRSLLNICAGAFGAAADCWPRVVAIAERRENERMRCWGWLDAAQTRLGAGDLDGATAAWGEVDRIPYDPRDGLTLIERHHTLADLRLRQGDDDAALANAAAVVEIVGARPPSGFYWADWCAAAAEIPLAIIGRASSDRARRELLDAARTGLAATARLARKFPNVRPRVQLLRGLVAWHHDDRDQAATRWRRALSLAQEQGMTFERGRALLELGSHGLDGGDAAVREARQIFTSLGAHHLARSAGGAVISPQEP